MSDAKAMSYQRFQVSVKEAAAILGVCAGTIYKMHRENEIVLTKLRRRTFVPISELERIRLAAMPAPGGEPVGEPAKRTIKKRKLFPMDI